MATALVTGGASGFGAEVARQLVRRAELLGDGAPAGLVDVAEHDVVAAADELPSDLGAEARRPAGDERDRHQAVAAATPVPCAAVTAPTVVWPPSAPPSPSCAPAAPSTRIRAMRSRCCAASPYAYSRRLARLK